MLKQCYHCKKILALQDFHSDPKAKDGHRGICKACASKKALASRDKVQKQCGGLLDVYYNIKKRCYDTRNKSYPRYGGRGIKMCDKWFNDRNAFVSWCLANGHKAGLELDRIDNNGDYCPENCRFVSRAENQHNTCKVKLDEKKVAIIRANNISRKKSQQELAKELGVSQSRISRVCQNESWSIRRPHK